MVYKKEIADQAEKEYIIQLMSFFKGNVTHAAQKSQILRTNLLRLMNKHNLKSMQFKNN